MNSDAAAWPGRIRKVPKLSVLFILHGGKVTLLSTVCTQTSDKGGVTHYIIYFSLIIIIVLFFLLAYNRVQLSPTERIKERGEEGRSQEGRRGRKERGREERGKKGERKVG